MEARFSRKIWSVISLAIVLALVFAPLALAAVWTDKEDYSPGSVVTIYGNTSYMPSEIVMVEVWGPNEYHVFCDPAPVVDESGEWTCNILLWEDDRAIGDYTYLAVGQFSDVRETGAFTDGPPAKIIVTANPESAKGGTFKIERINSGNKLTNTGVTPQEFSLDDNSEYTIKDVQSTVNSCTYTGPERVTGSAGVGGTTTTITLQYNCGKFDQEIDFGPLLDKTYGDAPFIVSATADSGLPVGFEASGNCTISSNTVTITGAGTCTITASQPGDDEYNQAPNVVRTFNIAKANATINVIGFEGFYDGNEHGASGTATGVFDEDLSSLLNLGEKYKDVPGGLANWSFTGNENYNSATGSVEIKIKPWTLAGFYAPVDKGIHNTIKGGATVPLKFEIFVGDTELTDTAVVLSLIPKQVDCEVEDVDVIDTLAVGDTSLRYDPSGIGQFIYNWKTPKGTGLCYIVTMTTQDGSKIEANFFTK